MKRVKTGEGQPRDMQAKNRRSIKNLTIHYSLFAILLLFGGCTFDYGTAGAEDSGLPDIVMNDVEYVRVRDGDPVVRFQAQRAERYEKRQTMELRDFSFEQFGNHGEDINAAGRAGTASVELDSGNIRLGGGVSIAVDSEDITIKTERLDWQDKERILSGEEDGTVQILREDGTNFTGWGFSAHVRGRTWEFSGGVDGTYIHEDEDEDAGEGEVDEAAEAAGGETPAGEDDGIAAALTGGPDRGAVSVVEEPGR